MKGAKSLNGIIWYLSKKHGGNVHNAGIVTITSKSVLKNSPDCALTNLADLTSRSHFDSKQMSGQWVCWDFREMRVRPTHYILMAMGLKSWVVEGSLDGKSWTEIDRQTDNEAFNGSWGPVSFSATPAEFRFIRLTQTGKRHGGFDNLALRAVEFFGDLSE
jgi:hypothetical protein